MANARNSFGDMMRGMYQEEYSEIQMPVLDETFVVPEGLSASEFAASISMQSIQDSFRSLARASAQQEQLDRNFQEESRRRMESAMRNAAAGGFSRRVANVSHHSGRGITPGIIIEDQSAEWDRSPPLIKGSEVVTCFGDYKGIVGKVEKVEWSKDQNDFMVTIKFDGHLETVRGEYVFRK